MVEEVSLNSDWHIYILTSNLFQKNNPAYMRGSFYLFLLVLF